MIVYVVSSDFRTTNRLRARASEKRGKLVHDPRSKQPLICPFFLSLIIMKLPLVLCRVAALVATVSAVVPGGRLKIYDSTSSTRPFSTSERGAIVFSSDVRNATFKSSSGELDSYLASKTKSSNVYRIGAKDHMGVLLQPSTQLEKLTAGGSKVKEILTLYLDAKNDLFHVAYEIVSCTGPASFIVVVDCMADHAEGPQVALKAATTKTKSAAKINTKFGSGSVSSKTGEEVAEPAVEEEGVIEEEEVVEERTLFQRYWIYLIPLAIVFLIGGSGPEEKE